MPCYHPLKAFKTATGVVFHLREGDDELGTVELPCGRCIGCRLRRSSDWELRVLHEQQMWPTSCFVTLTYAPGHLPPNASLEHTDFKNFLRRIRASLVHLDSNGQWAKPPVRYYMCGEYGPENLRPHYHACLFNVDWRDRRPAGKSESGSEFFESPTLTNLWGLGRASVQDLTRETASYCARYIMKKQLGNTAERANERILSSGEIVKVKPEYAAMSLKPGLGANWFQKYNTDVFPNDYVVHNGTKRPTPKYYDKLLKRKNQYALDEIKEQREQRARKHWQDNTDQRRTVREQVHLAQVKNLKRELK